MKQLLVLVLTAGLAACGGGEQSSDDGMPRGVSADEIVLGSHTDLSGGLAVWGVPLTNGMRMRFDEANEAGGIHGRQIRLVSEDTQYQVPTAVKATNKLINVDEIFMMIGSMGTPHNNAVFDRMFSAGVPNLFPLTAALSMYEPLHPMKFSYFVSYRDQVRGAIRYMVESHDISNVCLQAVATDYGEEVAIGFQQAVEENGLEVGYTGRHKGSETDFTGTATSIKNSDCDLLFLGPFVKDTILLYRSIRDAGWDKPIVGNMVPYLPEIAIAADGGMEGLYASASFKLPDYETEIANDTWVGRWHQRYVDKFGEPPAAHASIGYVLGDLAVRSIEAAGPEITTEKVLAGLESISNYEDPFGGPSQSYSATKHMGGDYLNLYQVQDSKWVTVAERLEF